MKRTENNYFLLVVSLFSFLFFSASIESQEAKNKFTFKRKIPPEGTKRIIKQTSKRSRIMKVNRRESHKTEEKKKPSIQSTRATEEKTVSKQVVTILKTNDERVHQIKVTFQEGYEVQSYPLPSKPEGIKDEELQELKQEATPEKKRKELPVTGKTYYVTQKEGRLNVTAPERNSVSKTEKAFVRTYFPVPGSLVTEENFLSQYLAGKTVSVGEKLTPPEWVRNQWAEELGGNVVVEKLMFRVQKRTQINGFDCAVFHWKAHNIQRQPEGRKMHAKLKGTVTVGIHNTWLFDEHLKGPLKYTGFIRIQDKNANNFSDFKYSGKGTMHNTRTVNWKLK